MKIILVWIALFGLIWAEEEGSGEDFDGPDDLFQDDGKNVNMSFPEGKSLKFSLELY